MLVYPANGEGPVLVYDETDNADHGELWTSVLLAEEVVVEMQVDTELAWQADLCLTSVGRGYRFFGEESIDKSGSCNIDVICPEGDDWRNEIDTVGLISRSGTTLCSGFMINNTANDARPLFYTAFHCGVTAATAPTLVVYWNYQSPTCGQQGGGELIDAQNGSTLLAASRASDFTLVELDDDPDPGWGVKFAGWNRSSADPTSAVAIHHPSVDEKSISFENDPLLTTTYFGNVSPGDGTHLRVLDWDAGTTEGGSSGSPLFDQDHLVVGSLHGGLAACNNDLADWYGRLSVAWTGEGTPSSRLSDWLDPDGSGVETLELFDPGLGPVALACSITAETAYLVTVASTLLDASGYPVGLDDVPVNFAIIEGEESGRFVGSNSVSTVNGVAQVQVEATELGGFVRIEAASPGLNGCTSSVDFPGTGLYEGLVAYYPFSGNAEDESSFENDGVVVGASPAEDRYGDPDAAFYFDSVGDYINCGDALNDLTVPFTFSAWVYPKDNAQYTVNRFFASDYGAVGISYQGFWVQIFDTGVIEMSYGDGTGAEATDRRSVFSQPVVAMESWSQVVVVVRGATDMTTYYNGSDVTSHFSGTGGEMVHNEYAMRIGSAYDGKLDEVRIYDYALEPDDVSDLYRVEVSGVDDQGAPRAPLFSLHSNFPNPFNPQTTIAFDLPNQSSVRLAVYDVSGRLVDVLLDGKVAAQGRNEAVWRGRDMAGRVVSAGVYFYRLEAGHFSETKRMVLVK